MTEPGPDVTDALAAPAELRRALRGAPLDDVFAAELLVDASAAVRTYCRWHISEVAGASLVLDGPGSRTLFLPTLWLTALTSVTEDGAALTVADLEWSRGGMIRKRSGACWTHRLSGVTVVISHGVPAAQRRDVARVVISLAARDYANPSRQRRASAGVVSDEFDDKLTEREKAVLAAWRVP